MSRTMLAIAVGIVLLVIAASVGFAQTGPASSCSPRDEMIAWLENEFEEVQRFAGTMTTPDQSLTTILELWFNEEAGTFSVLETMPDGMSCLQAFGNDGILDDASSPGEKI